jgi:transposase
MLRRHEVSDSEWERIKGFLPPENTGEGRPSKSNRDIYNAILWINRTGAPWRDLPERFGPWETVYSRFRLWSKNGVFKRLFEHYSSDADMQEYSIDSTSCKAHQHAAGAKRGQKTQKQTKT